MAAIVNLTRNATIDQNGILTSVTMTLVSARSAISFLPSQATLNDEFLSWSNDDSTLQKGTCRIGDWALSCVGQAAGGR
jgi:hypothetical protein